MAHFFLDYDNLVYLLDNATSVTSDSALKGADKTIFFLIKDEGESIAVAKNSDLFIRVKFTPELVKEAGNVQVNSSELSKILGTFSNLSRTRVESIEFKVHKSKVQVIVHESALDEDYQDFAGDTSYSLDSINIKEKTLQDISVEFDDENAVDVDSMELDIVLSTLLPIMDSKKGLNNNQIHFASDQIFVMDNRSQIFYKNILPEVFSNSSFRYTSVAYMRKLIQTSNHLRVVISGNKFAIRSESGEVEAYINQLGVRFNYKPTLEKITKENGIILDRAFLKDIIRRLSIMGSDPKVSIQEDGVHITTESFSRVIPISNSKGNVEGMEFKVNSSLLASMVIGDDSVMSNNLFLYLEPVKPRGIQLTISDDSGAFLSNTKVS
jgi:hypothetical protein